MRSRLSRRSAAPPSPANKAGFTGLLRLLLVFAVLALLLGLHVWLYPKTELGGWGFRYTLIPLVILFFVLRSASKFIQALYDFRSASSGFQHLMAAVFGVDFPTATISDGKLQVNPDNDNVLVTAGGPGYVIVQPGNTAIVESTDGIVRVLGPGRQFISRWESVKDAFSLEERTAHLEKIRATTKDGIEVLAKDVRYRYRLLRDTADSEEGAQRVIGSHYRVSVQAVKDATYNRNVTAAGLQSWHAAVNTALEAVIKDYVRTHQMDQIIAPRDSDPRQDIYQKYQSEQGRNQFKLRGAELLWVDIGHFEAADEQVSEQRVSTWQAKWIGRANIVRAIGESKRATYEELGRAEAQADMLQSIIEALDAPAAPGDPQQNRRTLYLARIAHLLQIMSERSLPAGETSEGK